MQINPIAMKVGAALTIAPGVKHFVLDPAPHPLKQVIPGQFITLHFEVDGKAYKRSYSVANPVDQSGQIEFAASYIEQGVGSEYLFALKPGDTVFVTGPFGRLILKEPPQRYILVGTGTGITPYRAMLPLLHERLMAIPTLQVAILHGVRTQEELIYAQDFREFVAAHPQAMFKGCLSREKKVNLAQDECLGHVQAHFDSLNLNPQTDLIYLCGNPKMIDEAYSKLMEKGFAVQQVVREKYISR